MNHDFKCPTCGHTGEIKEWDFFECACGNFLEFDETYDEESGDCWIDMVWSYHTKEAMEKAKKT